MPRGFSTGLLFLMLVVLVLSFSISSGLASETVQSSRELDASTYFLPPPNGWLSVGEGTTEDLQQTFGYGDFDADGASELVGSYSHSAVGIFIHEWNGNSWIKNVMHPRFNPALSHVRGMDGGWPVKGFVSGDFDNDSYTELISMADQVSYPPIHGNGSDTYPFPGALYVDWNGTAFTVNPLVWGAWGENISSRSVALLVPKPVPSSFRETQNPTNKNIKDFLICTLHGNSSLAEGTLFVLEQPVATFNSTDYRYIREGVMDTDMSFPNEPFYVKHLYEAGPGGDSEMGFSPLEFPGASSAWTKADVSDFDGDGMMDLIVTVSYENATTLVASSVTAFHRLPPKDDRNYRFEMVFRRDIPNVQFWDPMKAELNGVSADGKEGWIFAVATGSSRSIFGVNGVATLQWVGGEWNLLGTYEGDANISATYKGLYSHVVVVDADQDGYDDAVVYVLKEKKKGWPGGIGDLVLFRNLGVKIRAFPEHFAMDNASVRVVWESDSFSWDVHTEDFDSDGRQEIGVALTRKEPFWDSVNGTYQIWYAPATARSRFATAQGRPVAIEPTTFDASSSYSLVSGIVSYEWNFDDGHTATVTEPTVDHVYDQAGKYNVTLEITDGYGLRDVTFRATTVYYITDLNRDGTVNILDITIVAAAYNTKPGDPKWNAVADLDKNAWINILDISAVAKDCGKKV